MKQFLLILIFFVTYTATSAQRDCPAGYSYMPTIGTSSLTIIADTCLPDSVCKKLWIEFRKNMCGETSLFTMSGDFIHSVSNTWVNDSTGCVSIEKFEQKIKGKWVNISKCRFFYLNKGCYTSEGNHSCCGHLHKSLPD